MKKSLAILAVVGVAAAASAQSWEFNFVGTAGTAANPLNPGSDTATIRMSIDVPAGDYGLGGTNVNFLGGEDGWHDGVALLSQPGQNPGTPNPGTGDIMGASFGQLYLFGFTVLPGRLEVAEWQWTATDFTARQVSLETETTRYEVYATDPNPSGPGPVARPLPAEARGAIHIIPAPASLALLGLGGLAAARRRR